MYRLSELSTLRLLVCPNDADVANTDAGVDVSDPAGIFITFLLVPSV